MAQHDYIIANQSGAAFRADLNNALAAIVSQNSGAAEPSVAYAYMPWADTTTGLFKIRNAANSAWITLYQLDGEWSTIALENGTAAAPSLYFKDSGTDTGVYSPGADQVAIATAGVQRVNFNTTEVVFNDGGADVDFRVEGDTKTKLLWVDAGNDAVGTDGEWRYYDADASNYVGFKAPATVSGNVTWTLPSADGTNGQAIITSGAGVLGWATPLMQGTALTLATSVASTSGTSIDFTGIPSWVKRVTVMFNGVSTNGASNYLVQLGTSGGVESSGYDSSLTTTGAGVSQASSTAGFLFGVSNASASCSGHATLTLISGNTWISSLVFKGVTASNTGYQAGSKTLSGALGRIRITTVNGTDTFDAGSINILYEG